MKKVWEKPTLVNLNNHSTIESGVAPTEVEGMQTFPNGPIVGTCPSVVKPIGKVDLVFTNSTFNGFDRASSALIRR